MEVEYLFTEMKAFKLMHPTLENNEILKMFHIQAIQELTKAVKMGK